MSDDIGSGIDGTDGDIEGDIDRWVAEQRVDDAIVERRRLSWMHRLAAEEATLLGLLLDLAERGRPVFVHTQTGRAHRGLLQTIGGDYIGLLTRGDHQVLLRATAITAVRAEPGASPTIGDRTHEPDTTLDDAVRGLVHDQPRLFVVTADGEARAGDLRSVGRDVAVLSIDGAAEPVYLNLASVVEVALI